MPQPSSIHAIEPIVVALPRDTPYLGPLGPGEEVNERGYFVRRGNRTIYPTVDRSVLVKVTTADGTVGWGETDGIIAPDAVVALLRDVMIPIVLRRTADDPASIYHELYDLIRVRGGSGGFYGDALAAIDIALWDVKARRAGVALAQAQALGGARVDRIPAYVSGLPLATLPERVQLAQHWHARGFRGIKYAAVVSREGVAVEMHALRAALPPGADLMVDLHWQYPADEALALARAGGGGALFHRGAMRARGRAGPGTRGERIRFAGSRRRGVAQRIRGGDAPRSRALGLRAAGDGTHRGVAVLRHREACP